MSQLKSKIYLKIVKNIELLTNTYNTTDGAQTVQLQAMRSRRYFIRKYMHSLVFVIRARDAELTKITLYTHRRKNTHAPTILYRLMLDRS